MEAALRVDWAVTALLTVPAWGSSAAFALSGGSWAGRCLCYGEVDLVGHIFWQVN